MEVKLGEQLKEIAAQLKSINKKTVDPDQLDNLEKQLMETTAKFDFIGDHTECLLTQRDEEIKRSTNGKTLTDPTCSSETIFFTSSTTNVHFSTDSLGNLNKQEEHNEDNEEKHSNAEQPNATELGKENYHTHPISFMKRLHWIF